MNELVFRLFNSLAGRAPLGDQLIIFAASYLGWFLVAGLAVYLFFQILPRRRRGGLLEQVLFISASAIFAWLLAETIQLFYSHPRPFTVLTGISQLIPHLPGNSFPSGHATFFFALGTALSFYHRRLGVVYLAAALLIGLSRVLAGVHWPADVLFGFILGGLTVKALIFLVKFLRLRYNS